MNGFHLKLGLAFLLFAVGAALAGDAAVERFGDLTYDRVGWRVIAHDHGFLVQATGQKDEGDRAYAYVTFDDERCSADSFPEHRAGYYGRTRLSTIERPGFELHVSEYDIGCRNWRPPTVEACMTYKDKTYRFRSPVTGCRGGPPDGDGFVGFLKTLSAVD